MPDEKCITFPHSISLDERQNLTVSGVTDIGGYDEQTITVMTPQGELTVRGENLHIIRMSVEMGELVVEGSITSLQYTEIRKQAEGFFARLLK